MRYAYSFRIVYSCKWPFFQSTFKFITLPRGQLALLFDALFIQKLRMVGWLFWVKTEWHICFSLHMCSVTEVRSDRKHGAGKNNFRAKDAIVLINKRIFRAFYLKYSERNLCDQSLAIPVHLVYLSPRVPVHQSFTLLLIYSKSWKSNQRKSSSLQAFKVFKGIQIKGR